MRRLGIFGGTFDPVHWGHLLIAESALHQVPLEQVIWVPSFNPPHKTAARFEHRVAMLQQSIADNPGFSLSRVEENRPGTSFAINTLTDLSIINPDTSWYWILGLDAFKTLPNWYRSREIAQLCNWLIAPRLLGAENIAQSELICKQVAQQLTQNFIIIEWQLLHVPLVGTSSSLIRSLQNEHKSIRYLVPETVRRYIIQHRLYEQEERGRGR